MVKCFKNYSKEDLCRNIIPRKCHNNYFYSCKILHDVHDFQAEITFSSMKSSLNFFDFQITLDYALHFDYQSGMVNNSYIFIYF